MNIFMYIAKKCWIEMKVSFVAMEVMSLTHGTKCDVRAVCMEVMKLIIFWTFWELLV